MVLLYVKNFSSLFHITYACDSGDFIFFEGKQIITIKTRFMICV